MMRLLEELKTNYYRKGIKKVEPVKIIISILVLVVLVFFYFYKSNDLENREADRKENIRYTVGSTGKRYKNPKSSKPTVEFTYFYNLKKYTNREHVDAAYEQLVVEDKRYYVEFSYKYPKNCKLLLMYPVPDSVKAAPDDGWDYMPGYKK